MLITMQYIVFVALLASVQAASKDNFSEPLLAELKNSEEASETSLVHLIDTGKIKIERLIGNIKVNLATLNEQKADRILTKHNWKIFSGIAKYTESISNEVGKKSSKFQKVWKANNLESLKNIMYVNLSATKPSIEELLEQFIDAEQGLVTVANNIAEFLEQGSGVRGAKKDIKSYSERALNLAVEGTENLDSALQTAASEAFTSRD